MVQPKPFTSLLVSKRFVGSANNKGRMQTVKVTISSIILFQKKCCYRFAATRHTQRKSRPQHTLTPHAKVHSNLQVGYTKDGICGRLTLATRPGRDGSAGGSKNPWMSRCVQTFDWYCIYWIYTYQPVSYVQYLVHENGLLLQTVSHVAVACYCI